MLIENPIASATLRAEDFWPFAKAESSVLVRNYASLRSEARHNLNASAIEFPINLSNSEGKIFPGAPVAAMGLAERHCNDQLPTGAGRCRASTTISLSPTGCPLTTI